MNLIMALIVRLGPALLPLPAGQVYFFDCVSFGSSTIPPSIFKNIMGNQASSQIPSPAKSSFDEKTSFSDLSDSISSLSISNPLSGDGSLTLAHVAGWEAAASSDPKTKLARTILFHSDIRSALISRSAKILDQHVFSHTLDFKTAPITNQKSSGRCWLFATTNVLRYTIMKRLKLKDFQFSQVCCHPSTLNLYLTGSFCLTVLPLLLGQTQQVQLLPRAHD